MYLSKLVLDISHPSVRQALRNCQDMHRNLMKAFSGTREEAGMLYRLEKKRNALEVYVLSAQYPCWIHIAGNGYQCIGVKDISALREMYREGAVLRFDLRACPSKKVQGKARNSKRVFLRSEQERMEWLIRQAKKYGFSLIDAHETGICGHVEGSKGTDRIDYTTVDYSGVLHIDNPESFWNSYILGVGAGKAYGIGMMLLARA